VQHRGGDGGSMVANHRGGCEISMVVTTLHFASSSTEKKHGEGLQSTGSYALRSHRQHSSKSKTVRQLQTVLGIGMSG